MMPHIVLITGCAGFIGFHTARKLLQAGVHIVGVDNLNDYYDVNLKKARLKILQEDPHFTFHQTDIADASAMQALWGRYPDIVHVIHLAAQAGVRYSLENPYAYVQSNLQGHMVILELCRHRPGFKHLIYASSSSVYGNLTTMPLSPQLVTDTPISLYAATKKANELMSHSYAHLYKFPATGLRFFTVYGPWGRPDMSAYIFTKAIIEGTPIPVFNYGDMYRDFTFVEDIVAGILGALTRDLPHFHQRVPHKVYNLGNHRSEHLMRFIDVLEQAIGKPAQRDLQPMQPGDVPKTYADITESTQDLGFHPQTSIDEGVPQFVQWYQQYTQCK
jgi:UDP-glucuronate 4-epimerase